MSAAPQVLLLSALLKEELSNDYFVGTINLRKTL
jgi:hypothetical protein